MPKVHSGLYIWARCSNDGYNIILFLNEIMEIYRGNSLYVRNFIDEHILTYYLKYPFFRLA